MLFVYTGMGPQWWAMGRQLLQTQKVFREAAEECDEAFRKFSGRSILDELLAAESISRMEHTEVAQPANAVLQIATVLAIVGCPSRPCAGAQRRRAWLPMRRTR